MMRKRTCVLLFLTIVLTQCQQKSAEEYGKEVNVASWYHQTMTQVTDVIIHDIFTPPVASRIYGYVTLAGYEALVPQYAELKTMAGIYRDLKPFPQPTQGEEYCFPLASMTAMIEVAKAQTFTMEKYEEFDQKMAEFFDKAGIPSDVMERSKQYGKEVAKHVLAYAKGDRYPETRGLRYTVKNEAGKWVPTPPMYGDAMEPYWPTIRPFLMDSANQFPPAPVIPYSTSKQSPFWKEVMEVYSIGKNLTEEQKNIAWFWDDNAFVMNVQGHVSFANKKMTPGGHWLAITRTVAEQKKADLPTTAKAYLLVSAALHEGFIASWEEKYRSEKIRPETVINADLDPAWQPFLQTPPFPEYTSGHSTISAASAEVLTGIFGDQVAFTDSTEHKYGHGARTFSSFREAALECSISRVYGGIHYRSGCEEGQKAGARIGQFVLDRTQK